MSDQSNTRRQKGFLAIDDMFESIGAGNAILDPHSLLISPGVVIGRGNTFYPGVVLEHHGEGQLTIGSNNIFYPGTYIISSAGSISIGDGNEFGTGGCTIKANMADATIAIGDNGRYCDGTSIMGQTSLGSGSQVLGNIIVQSCVLEAGGTYRTPDPDERAAVLKGFGQARGVRLKKGQVVNGSGNFAERPVEWQRAYHPKRPQVKT